MGAISSNAYKKPGEKVIRLGQKADESCNLDVSQDIPMGQSLSNI